MLTKISKKTLIKLKSMAADTAWGFVHPNSKEIKAIYFTMGQHCVAVRNAMCGTPIPKSQSGGGPTWDLYHPEIIESYGYLPTTAPQFSYVKLESFSDLMKDLSALDDEQVYELS